MKTLKQLEQLRKVHKLIQQRKTEEPKRFAQKLHISERGLYRILEYLRKLDAGVSFSHSINSYYYTKDFDLFVNISVKILVNEELKTIYGGSAILNENFINLQLNPCTDGI